MSATVKNVIAGIIGIVALVVIVSGLTTSDTTTETAEDRVAALAAVIKCPFCNGESLADSASGVAADYRLLIAERVEAGYTDDEILDEFAANFGESYVLDSSRSSWSVLLWLVPLAGLALGAGAILWMRRASERSEEVAA